MRRFWVLVTVVMMVLAMTAPASATLSEVDIDSNGDCEIEGVVEDGFANGANVHVAINGNWIVATCHVELTDGEVELLGGPFMRAYVNRNFSCFVGNDDTLEDVPSDRQVLTVTPSGQLNITCQAENPGTNSS